MRRWIPVIAAGAAFLVSLAMLRPEPSRKVLVATADLPAGWRVRPEDVEVKELPDRSVPPDALSDPKEAVGKTLRLGRAKGDVLRASTLGAPVDLRPDERAIGVKVSDPAGLAGTLQPGARVGVVAVVFPEMGRGAFSKVAVEGLRVLYIAPEFSAAVPEPPLPQGVGAPLSALRQRRTEGTVILAVPTAPLPVRYARPDGQEEERLVNVLELLSALNVAQNATLYLYAAPEGAQPFATAGLFLEELLPSGTITRTEEIRDRPR